VRHRATLSRRDAKKASTYTWDVRGIARQHSFALSIAAPCTHSAAS